VSGADRTLQIVRPDTRAGNGQIITVRHGIYAFETLIARVDHFVRLVDELYTDVPGWVAYS